MAAPGPPHAGRARRAGRHAGHPHPGGRAHRPCQHRGPEGVGSAGGEGGPAHGRGRSDRRGPPGRQRRGPAVVPPVAGRARDPRAAAPGGGHRGFPGHHLRPRDGHSSLAGAQRYRSTAGTWPAAPRRRDPVRGGQGHPVCDGSAAGDHRRRPVAGRIDRGAHGRGLGGLRRR